MASVKSGLDREILEQIDRCSKDLTWWNSNYFGNVQRELDKKRRLLIVAESEAMRNGYNNRVRELNFDIVVLLDREARMWNQRSRVLWLSKGNSNTKFSHSQTTQRHRKNSILSI